MSGHDGFPASAARRAISHIADDQGLYVPSGNAAPTVEWHPAWTNIENKGTGFTENGRYVLNGDTIIF
ncbi:MULTISPECIES: hypothetical protein [unclassified Streptomyces]|uniref:hypothetical protein n=1 Tax=unclassified Streptomyces TaxID=2593676 RepID=UPI0034401321